MKEFKCDKYSKMYAENGWKIDDVPCLTVQEEEGMIRIDTDEIENGAAVFLTADAARELAGELNRLADELDGVYRHDEIRGTMFCSSLVMPIKPRP